MSFKFETQNGFQGAVQALIDQYAIYINIFIALAVLTAILVLTLLFSKLAAEASNSQKRARTIHEIIVVLVCTALLGAAALIYSYCYYIFNV